MNVNRFIAIDEYLEVSPIDRNRKLGRLDQLSNHIHRVSRSHTLLQGIYQSMSRLLLSKAGII